MDNGHKSRAELKAYFKQGAVPTEEQFAQLIDSMHNLADDGQATATSAAGLRLFPTDASGTLAAVFAQAPEADGAVPLWRLALAADGSLNVCGGDGEPVMTIDKNRNITLSGTLKATRYLSGKGHTAGLPKMLELEIQADGMWHDLPVESAVGVCPVGCRVYRLSACYNNLRNRSYSVCEVLASHADGRKRKIRSSCKHGWGWSGHIKVRWQHLDSGRLYLQLRSKRTGSGSKFICCRLETVWEIE